MKKLFNEFKAFVNRGNVIDMAIGVIIGGGFGKIVSSLVADVVMPAVSMLTGRVSFADRAITIPALNEGAEPIVIAYGLFVQSILDFLIIALAVFLVIKLVSKLSGKREKPPAPPEPTKEEQLLTEIRDLLAEARASQASTAGEETGTA